MASNKNLHRRSSGGAEGMATAGADNPSHFDAVSPYGAVPPPTSHFDAGSPMVAQMSVPSNVYRTASNMRPSDKPPRGAVLSPATSNATELSSQDGGDYNDQRTDPASPSSVPSTHRTLSRLSKGDAVQRMNSLLGTPLSRLGSLARDPEGRMQLGRMASLGTIPAGALDLEGPAALTSMSSGTTDSDLDSPVDGKALSRIKTRTGLGGHLAYGDKSKHAVQDYTDALADSGDQYGDPNKVPVCNMCGDTVADDPDGFVPCECSFRLCATCLEHVASYEGNKCPGCRSQLRDKENWLAMQAYYHEEGDTPRMLKKNVSDVRRLTAPPSKRVKTIDEESGAITVTVNAEMVPVNLADYGYGSVAWETPPDKSPERAVPKADITKKGLFRTIHVDGSKLGPYRIFTFLRFVFTGMFLYWRCTHPTTQGYWLWVCSIFAEVWFFFSWILDTLPKLSPVDRETYKDRLRAIYDEGGEKLPQVDVFITTADVTKEPPLTTAQTILSVLSVDYPTTKLACYLSDDGSAKLMFDVMAETAGYARLWVPFCKKYNIEPRNPEQYFGQNIDFTAKQIQADFVKSRRKVKREYEEFKVRVNALVAASRHPPPDGWKMRDGTPWPGNNRRNHDGIIQVFLHPDGDVRDVEGNFLPPLVYVSREKRPGIDHNKKAGAMNALLRASGLITNGQFIFNLDCDHYVNNCQAVRDALCFFLDPIKGGNVGFVQFPQRFDGIDRSDRWANRNEVFFDVNMKGLDGQQGPVYVGTGCFFRRKALYGYYPANARSRSDEESEGGCCFGLCCCCGGSRKKKHASKAGAVTAVAAADVLTDEEAANLVKVPRANNYRLGMCAHFIDTAQEDDSIPVQPLSPRSMLSDVVLAISCDYEEQTDWGDKIGWMYGSITEDILTGLRIHTRGWISIYCNPERAAFKGSAPLNMTDRLVQVLRWGTGAVEIFFSKRNPAWTMWNTELMLQQRIAYATNAFYPFTSIALFMYCLLAPLSLLTNLFFVPTLDRYATVCFTGLIGTFLACSICELRWSKVSFEAWWRNEQFWVIAGTSAHLAAVLQGILKVTAGLELSFTLTAKGSEDGEEVDELHTFKFSNLLVIPSFIGLFNILGVVAGFARVFMSGSAGGSKEWGKLFGKLCFSFWVLIHMYPFAKGMMGKRDRLPTIVIVWTVLIVVTVSLIWSAFFGGY